MSRQSFSSPLDRLILQLACCTGYLSSPHTEPLASPRPHIRRNNSQRLCMEEHSLPITGLEVRPEIWPQHDVLSLRLLRLLVILRLFKQLNLFSFLKHRRIAARIKTINPYSANQALPVLIHPCQFICNLLANQPLRKIYGIGALYYCFPQHHPCHIFSFSITMLFLRRENYTIPGMLFLRLQFPVGIRPLSGNP